MDIRHAVITILAIAVAGQGATAQCVGDCHADGEVTVDELLIMVNIALESAPITQCEAGDANADGMITVDEIVTGVNNALSGCGPNVTGSWRQDQATIVSSTCAPDITNIMQEVINEGDFNCTYDLQQNGSQVTITEICDSDTVTVTGSVDGTGRVTVTVSGQDVVDSCVIGITDTLSVDVSASPTPADHNAVFSFTPNCGFATCTIVVQTRWTALS